MIGGYLVRVTVPRGDGSSARLLYVVAEDDEERALAVIRKRSAAVASAIVESLGPTTKAEVRKHKLKPGDAKVL
jgi:hypothetical protein